MSLPGGSRLKNAHLHAIILGSAFLISLSIILVRVSLARRDSAASAEPPVAAGGGGASSPEDAPGVAAPATVARDPAEEVEDILDRAEALYQSSASEEGRETEIGKFELEEASRLLVVAGEILETLPPDDPRTRELRNRWSLLRQDVSRASGF